MRENDRIECPQCHAQIRLSSRANEEGQPLATEPLAPPTTALDDDLPSTVDLGRRPAGAARPMFQGNYELLELLGRGGMGVVYKARQTALNRLVALKMIRAGDGAGSEDLRRFQLEAEAVARLQHPHIVQVYDVGQLNGQPYLALEYVPGGTLAQQLRQRLPAPRDAANTVEQLARAVHSAHGRGIVHRDLKPANVLLTSEGEPKIGDFGLAKHFHEDGRTETGAVLGTPSYMAPEQASGGGKDVGPAADVYSLGAILYESLTGTAPFTGDSVLETLEQVLHREPTPPRQLRSETPRDLETICLKCLEKEPRRRYASAEALADELRRFQNGEPIHARHVGRLQRAAKWARRRPAQAALLVVSVAAVVCLLAVSLAYNARLQFALDAARTQRELAQTEGRRAEAQRQEALAQRGLAETQRNLAVTQGELAQRRLEDARRQIYLHAIEQAYDYWRQPSPNIERGIALLESVVPGEGEADLRDFEWGYLWRLFHCQTASAGRNAQRFVWQSDDTILLTDGDELSAWSLPDQFTDVKIPRRAMGISIAPRGSRLAWHNGDAWVWSPRDAPQPPTPLATPATAASISRTAWTADGTFLAAVVSGEDHRYRVRVWNLSDGQLCEGLTASYLGGGLDIAFSPRRPLLAIGRSDGSVLLYDAAEEKIAATLSGVHTQAISALAFSPDGARLFTAADDDARIQETDDERIVQWNVAEQKATGSWQLRPAAGIWSLACSPDRQALAIGTGTSVVLLADAATGAIQAQYKGHSRGVGQVAFAPGGAALASLDYNGNLKVWNARENPQSAVVGRLESVVAQSICWSPDGRWLAYGGNGVDDHAAALVLRNAENSVTHELEVEALRGCDFSFDGTLLAAVQSNSRDDDAPGTVRLFDVDMASKLREISIPQAKILNAVFVGNRRLALACDDGTIRLWSLDARRQTASLEGEGNMAIDDLAADRRGRLLLSRQLARRPRLRPMIDVWDLASGKLIQSFPANSKLGHFAISPDGRWLALPVDRLPQSPQAYRAALAQGHDPYDDLSRRQNHFIDLIDTRTMQARHTFPAQPLGVAAMAFSPSGERLVISTREIGGGVEIWDVTTGRQLLTLAHNGDYPSSLAFSPTGEMATISISRPDSLIRRWKVADFTASPMPPRN